MRVADEPDVCISICINESEECEGPRSHCFIMIVGETMVLWSEKQSLGVCRSDTPSRLTRVRSMQVVLGSRGDGTPACSLLTYQPILHRPRLMLPPRRLDAPGFGGPAGKLASSTV